MYRPLIVAAVAAIVAGPAHAHVSFENAQAAVGTTYKAVLRIPHGCDGKATDEVRVPEGVIRGQADAQGRMDDRKDGDGV